MDTTVSTREFRRWKPIHLRAVYLYVRGYTFTEIAGLLNYSVQWVQEIIDSAQGQEMLKRVEEHTFDSMLEVQDEVQLVAPEALQRKIQFALSSPDENLANKACSELLAIAGHTPVKRVSVEQADPIHKKYEGRSEEDIRAAIEAGLLGETPLEGPKRGPDGGLLN